MAADILKMDYINSLGPLLVCISGSEWPLETIDVQTGCLRFDVVGMLQHSHIDSVIYFKDLDGNKYDPDTFYIESENDHKN